MKDKNGKTVLISTAAWACIEFLRFFLCASLGYSARTSQQPLGLVLSFYKIQNGKFFTKKKESLNSRLGLY